MWNICSSLQKFLYRILHRHTRNWYFSLMNISHNLLIHYFSRDWKKSYGMLPPIHNLVNRYDQWPPPRIPKQALHHEAKINSSPKSPKLDLCLRPALSQKPPLISHQRKTLCLCPHSQISRRLLLIWSIWHCVIIHKINHPNGDFPEFSEPNPILSDHSFCNSLPDCLW